jgi:hypothetical protein
MAGPGADLMTVHDARFGRWAFLEISDPWDAKNKIRAALAAEEALA